MKAKATELEQRVELLQHRVQEEETRFRNMLVRSADGVLIVDRAGAVRFVNPAAESILGRPAQKLLGAEFGVPLVVNDRVEIDLVREPGQLRIAELRVIDIEWDGQPAHLASLRDVTEYKRAEQAEREARVLAEALRDSAAALSGTLYLDEVLDRILVQTGRVVPHDAASVLLMESGVVRVARVHNPADRALLQWGGPFRIDVGDSPALRHMADTGETLVISDTHQEPGWTSQLETGWINQSEMGRIGSFVGAPIRAGDQVYGFLVLVSTTRGFYHPLHAQRLSIFADQAAAALQNARLHQATLRAAESRAVLHRASHEVATSLDPEQVYVATHRAVENLMPAEAFSIALLDETRQEIEAVYLYDRRGRVAGMRIPAQRGLSGHVIATGRPVRIDDLETGAGIDVVHFGDPVHVRSVIAVPMRQGDKVFGMLSTQSYRPHAFTDGDVQMLDLLANQATTAIVNAQLFAAERQRRQELEAIYQASLGVVASLDVRQVLGAIVRSATRLVPLLDAHIFLYDGETLTFGAAGSQAGAMSEPFAEPRPRGLTYTVARTGEPIIVEDTSRHPLYADTPWSPFAIIGVPLKIGSTVVGVMNVAYPAPHRFTESELRLLSLLAAQAAIAVHNARLHDQVQRHAAELEQRVAERTAELDRQRRLMQAILDAAGEGIVFTDLDARIEYLNPAMQRITGYSAADALGQNPRIWQSGRTPLSVYKEMWSAITHGEAWQGDIVNRRKDGTLYHAAMTAAPLTDANGQARGYVGVQRDITRQKELDHLKDLFVSNVSHELRTPLTNIKLYLGLLEHGRSDKRGLYMETLNRETARLEKLINDLLDLSRLDLGTVPIHMVATDVNRLAADLITDRAALASARGISLDCIPDADLPPALADSAMIAQVMSNLLANAVNYTPAGGLVTVTSGVRHDADGDWVTFTVQDTGPGISADDIPHVFGRFYRGLAGRGSGVPGTGLGLAICKEIVDRLEGRITVNSPPGEGTAFTVWLRPARGDPA